MILNDVISFEHIIHISQKTTEKITQKNLKSFLITSLEIHNYPKEFFNQIIYRYFPEKNIYEIYAYNSKGSKSILEYQIYENYYLKYNILPSLYDLFIYENYFCVYKDGSFCFAKDNRLYENEEILQYISYVYDIDIKNIYCINRKQRQQLLEERNMLKPIVTISLVRKTKEIVSYMVIFILSIVAFLYLLYNQNNMDKKILLGENVENLKKKYEHLSKKRPKELSKDMTNIFLELKKYNLQLVELKYDKTFHMNILVKHKEDVFHFAKYFNKKIKIGRMVYNQEQKRYFVEISIEH